MKIVWTFAELKLRARTALSRGYGKSVIAVLLCHVLQNLAGSFIMKNSGMPVQDIRAEMLEDPEYVIKLYQAITNNIEMVIGLVGMLLLMTMLISVFILIPLNIGKNRYFNEVARGNISLKEVFFSFTGGMKNYLSIVKTAFLKNAVLVLWGIIGIVLGVGVEVAAIFLVDGALGFTIIMYVVILISIMPVLIKSYQYIMVEYILTDEPDIGARAALKKSKQMTKGHKFRIFLLPLTFIGWYLLGSLAFGVGIFFVLPYVQATLSELYLVLKGDKKTNSEMVEWYSKNYSQED